MTVGELLDILTAYDTDENVEIEIYDKETNKYLASDEKPTIDKNGLDFVFVAKI